MAAVYGCKAKGRCNGVPEDEEPEMHLAEEGKKVLKQMLARQTNTAVSFKEQRLRERQFTREGHSSEGVESQKQTFQSTRHYKELTASLQTRGPSNAEALLVQLALTAPERSDYEAFREAAPHEPEHPINHLDDLERRLFGHLRDKPPPKATSKKRRRLRYDNATEKQIQVPGSSVAFTKKDARTSLWDVKDAVPRPPRNLSVTQTRQKSYGPQLPKQFTIRKGRIVPLDEIPDEKEGSTSGLSGPQENGQPCILTSTARGSFALQDIRDNRLSLEQIKQLPRFSNYCSGEPSKVLFVKNVSESATENDLAEVFAVFHEEGTPSPILRLMTGRMRGQAFVTFHDVEIACQALREVNGYQLHDKPLVVQFGRSRCAEDGATNSANAESAPNAKRERLALDSSTFEVGEG